MFKNKSRRKPTEVFTPKAPNVNEDMYISRPNLERKIERALEGTYHVIIHGESGSGKSWLYKSLLKKLNCEYISLNLANASTKKSIESIFEMFLNQEKEFKKVEYTEKIMAEANVAVAKGQIDHTEKFVLNEKEPFLQCLEYIRKRARKEYACIVLDNLEAIFEEESLMKELGNLILLLDDSHYAKYDVKFIIVGVPSQFKEYFSKTANLASISNRLEEIPEVASLNKEQVESFVKKGFTEKLKVKFSDTELEELISDIYWSTLGIPQRLHEYCLKIAYCLEDNDWIYNNHILKTAKIDWINQSLTANYSIIEELMNSRGTTIQRKNQVLFALGKVQKPEFKALEIEEILKVEFPTSTKVTMNIGQILSEISNTDNPPIKKTPKGDSYIFIDPKFCICLRMMLMKNKEEKIEKLPISSI